MKPDWTLIANASHARLLQQQRGEPMAVLKSFSHPESRSKVSELADDRAGHETTVRASAGASYSPHIDAKRKEHMRFANELADYLEHEAGQGRFRTLTVFASSPFLGDLKAELGNATSSLLAGTHDVDLTAVGLAELERRIAHELHA
jgi:protein required for attachment to host cells